MDTWLFFPAEEEVVPAAFRDYQFGGVTLPAGWTLTRSGAAMGRSPANGRWISYAADTPRPAVDPLTLAVSGTLLETATTQIVLNSRTPGYATNNSTSVAAPDEQTPFGLGALKLTPGVNNTSHGFNFYFEAVRSSPIADNTTVAIRAVLKPVGAYTRVTFFLQGRDGGYQTCTAELSGAGSIIDHSLLDAAVLSDTDGYFSVCMVRNYAVGAVTPTCHMSVVPPDGNRFFAADGTSHVMVAFFGAEVGDVVTSPVISAGGGMSRPADTLKLALPWPQTGGVAVGMSYTPLSKQPFTALRVFEEAASGSSSNFLDLTQDGPTALYRVASDGASSASIQVDTPGTGISRTAVISAGPDHFRFALDGEQKGVDPKGSMPVGMSAITLGATEGGAARGSMIVSRLKIWDEPLWQNAVEAYSADLAFAGTEPDLPIIDVQATRLVTPAENSVTLVITVDGQPNGVVMSYRTVPGTALDEIDYVSTSGTVYLSPGQVSHAVTILLADRAPSEDRTFTLEVYDPVNAKLGQATCTITLQRVIPEGTAATNRYDFDTETLSPDWTLTRSTAANTRNAGGLWVSVAANLPRLHHHAPGLTGLLLEPQASDQRLYDSVDPALGVVAATRSIVTSEQTATGSRLLRWRMDATTADHKVTGVFTTAVADMPTGEFTLWFMARPVGIQHWKLRTKGIDNVWRETRVNLSGAGLVTATDAGSTGYAAQDLHFGDWFQMGQYRSQTVAAGVNGEFELIPVDAAGVNLTAGNTALGIDICHIQLEPTAGISSPLIVTGASAKTSRGADALRANTAATWYKQASYSAGIKFIRLRNQPTTQRVLMLKQLSSPTASPDDIGLVTAPASLRARLKVANVQFADISSPDLTAIGDADTAMLVVDAAAEIGFFHNGVKISETAITAPPTAPGFLRIGSSEPSGNDPMQMLLQMYYHWDHIVPDNDALLFSGNLGFVPSGPPAPPIISIPTALSVREGQTVSVTIAKSGTGACSITFRTRGATATNVTDYTGYLGSISFAANETSKVVTLPTIADTVSEPTPETFNIILEAPVNCVMGNAVGTVTIYEQPRVDVASAVSVIEGQAAAVTLTKTGPGACSVTYRTVEGSALRDVDYAGVGATTVSFADGDTTKTVQIQTVDDAAAENTETFSVVIENAVDCTIGGATCTVTIQQTGTEIPAAGQLYPTPITFANTTAAGATVDFGVGQVPYYVTSLADTNTQGTLRHALSASNRMVIFEVAGIIKIPEAGLNAVNLTNVTVAGETAPSPGIIIQGGTVYLSRANGMNIRHITFETGYDTRQEDFEITTPLTRAFNSNKDSIIVQGSGVTRNLWIDHCTTLWSNDEAIQLWIDDPKVGTFENSSVTNTLMAEPLWSPPSGHPRLLINPATGTYYKGHWEGGQPETEHNYGFIIGDGVKRMDVQYNVYVDCHWREPLFGSGSHLVLANNLSLNGRVHAQMTRGDWTTTQGRGASIATCVGFLVISGQNTDSAGNPGFKLHAGRNQERLDLYPDGWWGYAPDSKAWVTNLYGWRGAKSTYPLPATVVYGRGGNATLNAAEQRILMSTTGPVSGRPLDLPKEPVKALTDVEIYNRAIQNVGARPKDRKADGSRVLHHAQRQIDKLKAKDGYWISHQIEVGGFSTTTQYPQVNRSLRNGTGKFKDGTTIPAFPTPTDKPAVRAWLRRFLDEVQYD